MNESAEVVTLEDHLALVHHVLEILLEPDPSRRVDRERERVLLTMAIIAIQQSRTIVSSRAQDNQDKSVYVIQPQGVLVS